jgi:methylation protein EvaC
MNSTAKGIGALWKRDGIFVFEDPYLGNLIQNVAYDQIYDEHAYIFSLNSIKSIFEPVGMEIFHIEQYPTYGGSMRYFIGFKGEHQMDGSCLDQWERENRSLKLDCLETYQRFAKRCEQQKRETIQLLTGLKQQGKRIVGYGAPSKSTIVLNYCNIGCDILDCIYDTTPIKQGKFSPGKHIPIRAFTNDWFQGVDDALLFIWNHKQEVLEKETSFRQKGGQWIILTPAIRFCVFNG